MASPYMTKDRVRDTMLTIDSLVHYLETFLESNDGDFYDKIDYSAPHEEENEDER